MAGRLAPELRRIFARAVMAGVGGLALAVAVGIGAWTFGARPPQALAAAAEAVAEIVPGQAVDLHSLFVRTETTEVPAIVTPGANEQAIEASRLEAPAAAIATPTLAPGDKVAVTVSYYYCAAGQDARAVGDGGGFCGRMRDGTVVHTGAAACDVVYLGQLFRIEGDPLRRVYRCSDTGSLVGGLHRDVWFDVADEGRRWLDEVGHQAVIEVLP